MQQTRRTDGETALAAAFSKAFATKKHTPATQALQKAIAAVGGKGEKPSTERRRVRRDKIHKKVLWGHREFGTLTIDMEMFDIGEESDKGPYVWTRIRRGQHTPPQMHLGFTAEMGDGVVLLHAQGGNVTDVTAGFIPRLPVDINWSAGRRPDDDFRPHTRRKDADNVDFVFMRRSDGKFIQIQVSIVTRKGAFYIGIQEIWAGQVVRTTLDNAKTLQVGYHLVLGKDSRQYAALVVPLYDENAYPGADYLKTFKNMGPKVIEYANLHGMTAPLSSAVMAEWTPIEVEGLSEEMIAAGYRPGIVTFFNLVVNFGFIQDSNGMSHFVYGDSVVDEVDGPSTVANGGFPVLEPMMGVVFKVGPGKKPGQTQAVSVYQPQ